MSKLLNRLAVKADDGVTLLEVIVAISIVVVIATASAGLVINGMAAAATQERRQVAVSIASGLLEQVSANAVESDSTGLTRAAYGRTAAAVTAAWAANSGKAGVSTTTPALDLLASTRPTVVNPISSTVELSGTTYTGTVLIGTCYQPKSGGDCIAIPIPPSTVTQLVRVIVIVRWTPGTSCAANECFYQTSTLLDPHADLEWVTSG